MQGNTKSPVQDPFIRTNKLLPTLLLLMGGMNKYDVSERKMARVLSRLYKVCILFLINVTYWKTILFPDNHKTRQKTGSELGVCHFHHWVQFELHLRRHLADDVSEQCEDTERSVRPYLNERDS